VKQPNEDITGKDRYDDLILDTTDAALPMRKTIMFLTENLYREALGPRARYELMMNPEPGELVVVTDHLARLYYRDDVSPDIVIRSLGYLVEHREEWWDIDEEWQKLLAAGEYGADDKRPTDKPYYVQYGPDAKDICRWTNCQVLRVPQTLWGWM
jgi:hypothetical protein